MDRACSGHQWQAKILNRCIFITEKWELSSLAWQDKSEKCIPVMSIRGYWLLKKFHCHFAYCLYLLVRLKIWQVYDYHNVLRGDKHLHVFLVMDTNVVSRKHLHQGLVLCPWFAVCVVLSSLINESDPNGSCDHWWPEECCSSLHIHPFPIIYVVPTCCSVHSHHVYNGLQCT